MKRETRRRVWAVADAALEHVKGDLDLRGYASGRRPLTRRERFQLVRTLRIAVLDGMQIGLDVALKR